MSKRRKTRKQKIFLQLKRELAQKQVSQTVSPRARQEAVSASAKPKFKPESKPKRLVEKAEKSVFSYDPSLIKKDLFKTLALTAIILSLELVIYLKLR